jgi:hypothetical protein
MAVYQLRLFDPGRRIIAVQRFSAETDTDALSIARNITEKTSAVAWFDIWEGERHIHGAAPTAREKTRWAPT